MSRREVEERLRRSIHYSSPLNCAILKDLFQVVIANPATPFFDPYNHEFPNSDCIIHRLMALVFMNIRICSRDLGLVHDGVEASRLEASRLHEREMKLGLDESWG